jgi:hypothetical protein
MNEPNGEGLAIYESSPDLFVVLASSGVSLPTEQLPRPDRFSRLEYLDNGFVYGLVSSVFINGLEGVNSG